MISGAHFGIMTDGEFDFSDKEHEAALQALIKDGNVEVVLDENGYRELRLTEIGEAYAQWVFDNWGDPLPTTLFASKRSEGLRVACLINSAEVNKKGSRFFWTPDSDG